MEKYCSVCNTEFKDEDEVALDLMDKLTHMDCYEGNTGLILSAAPTKTSQRTMIKYCVKHKWAHFSEKKASRLIGLPLFI